jgi:NAD+ kinase
MSRGAVGFLLHPDEGPGTVTAAVEAAVRCGYRTWTTTVRPAEDVAEHGEGTELLVTIGGDGTFLFGARLAAPRDIPVLGVNRGRLGFLTDMELDQLPAAIEAFAGGRTLRQRRSMLAAEIDPGDGEGDGEDDGEDDPAGRLPAGPVTAAGGGAGPEADRDAGRLLLALNDIVLKSPRVSLVRLRVEADGELLGEFDADGVVVSTATGSTGYALSAGGPPIDPRVHAITVVPLAPHAVITRPIVLPEVTVVEVTITHGRVYVAADGQHQGRLGPGGRVRIGPGPELSVVRCADSPSFLRQLRDKVHFGLPLKPADRDRSPATDPPSGPFPGSQDAGAPTPPGAEPR